MKLRAAACRRMPRRRRRTAVRGLCVNRVRAVPTGAPSIPAPACSRPSQVNRGGKLGEHEGLGFSEMTVEDLLEVRRASRARAGTVLIQYSTAAIRRRCCCRLSAVPCHAACPTFPSLVCSLASCGVRRAPPSPLIPPARSTPRPPRQVVRRLPPEASAVKAVGQGLYYFDSGALAALLKELNKSGHVRRAQEVRARAGCGGCRAGLCASSSGRACQPSQSGRPYKPSFHLPARL